MEKENGFVLFLKGVLVGIGNMIAGISGGTIAFITGIYEKMVYSLANLTKDFWPNFLYLIKIMLGVLVGLLGCAKVLNILFSHIILEMILLFTGVLLGGIYNDRWDYVFDKKYKKSTLIIALIIAFLVIMGMTMFNLYIQKRQISESPEEIEALHRMRWTNIKFPRLVLVFFFTIIGTTAMIFPGISGSLLFMSVGIYYPVLNALSDLTRLSNWQNPVFVYDILKLGCALLLGAIVSLLFISKPINYIFMKYRRVCLFVILGFLIASIFSMYILNYRDIVRQFDWWHPILGVLVFMPLGFMISLLLNNMKLKEMRRRKKEERKSQKLLKDEV